MADFNWKQWPTYGTCITCGSSANTRGFVDMIADVNVIRDNYNIVGNVDVVVCADCLTQAAGVIGCIPADKAEAMAWSISELSDATEKAYDEAVSWRQRYENLLEVVSLMGGKEANGSSDISTERSDSVSVSPSHGLPEGREFTPAGDGESKSSRKRKGV